MRKIIVILFLASCLSVFAQELTPDEKNTEIQLTVKDEMGKPINGTVVFKNNTTHKIYKTKTDAKGKSSFSLPQGYNYAVGLDNSAYTYTIAVVSSPDNALAIDLVFRKVWKNMATETAKQQVLIKIFNTDIVENITLVKEDTTITKQEKVISDAVVLQVPEGIYTIQTEKLTTIDKPIIKVDSLSLVDYYVLFYKNKNTAQLIPVKDLAFCNINYTNLVGKKINNELITITSEKTGIIYTNKTTGNGSCYFLLPKNSSYKVSINKFTNIEKIEIGSEKTLITKDLEINYPSSEEQDSIEIAENKLLAIRDSLYLLKYGPEILSEMKISTAAKDDFKKVIEELKEDKTYFEKVKNTVCAVLYRLRSKISTDLIVTDVTGSMYPYIHQVLVWHQLNRTMSDKKTLYVFFNDGDNMSDFRKVIGNTGGIYDIKSENLDVVVHKMNYAMRKGNGGDGPENDLEALLTADQLKKTLKEIILVADNYSSVKDIKLLEKLNTPVRIILCGAEMGRAPHPDYLRIAYKTKGSIHTIENDIFDLCETKEGGTVVINGQTYKLIKGQFFPLNY